MSDSATVALDKIEDHWQRSTKAIDQHVRNWLKDGDDVFAGSQVEIQMSHRSFVRSSEDFLGYESPVKRGSNFSRMRGQLWKIFKKKKTAVQPIDNPFLEAISRQKTDAIARLLKTTRVSKEELNAALVLSSALGQAPVCRLLLKNGADPCASELPEEHAERHGTTPPAFSVRQAHTQAWLAQHTSVGGTALHRAAENNQVDCAKILLEYGSKINATDHNGITALMVSCTCPGGMEMTCLLASTTGCDVNMAETRMGRTALHYAAQGGNAESVSILLDAGADVDVQDLQQNTALVLSSTPCPGNSADDERGQARALECLKVLLEGNCFVNLFNRDSETALHRAVENRSLEAVSLLLRYGAIVHPEIIRDACLLLRDDRIIQVLLKADNSLHDDFLLTILIALIVTETSCWTFNNESQQDQVHFAARHLLQRIKDINSLDSFLHQLRPAEIETMFGEDFAHQFKKSAKSDLVLFGLFGLALRYGKYSVARLIYLSGSDVTLMQMIRDTEVGKYLRTHPYNSSWIGEPFNGPAPLKILARTVCKTHKMTGSPLVLNYYPAKLCDFLNMTDLDKIQPFDATVKEVGEAMLDQSYSGREMSKAARQQLLWLYN